MNTRFQFRLNAIIITESIVRPVMIDGIANRWELVACHDTLGEFAIDTTKSLLIPRSRGSFSKCGTQPFHRFSADSCRIRVGSG
jgi:hypothetical protein